MSEELKEQVDSVEELVEDQEGVATAVAEDDTPSPDNDTEEPAELTLEEQLEAAKAEAAKNLDGWMRAQAEFANARKRMEKQRAETYLNATANVVEKLLPAIDDFDRAMQNIPAEIVDNGWLEGIELVQRKLNTILDNLNVKQIEAVGQPFDPLFHEAIMQEESDEYESGTVSKELQKGYQIGEKVIRPSLVYVSA